MSDSRRVLAEAEAAIHASLAHELVDEFVAALRDARREGAISQDMRLMVLARQLSVHAGQDQLAMICAAALMRLEGVV